MLKKINVRDVKLGMYLQEVCGSWMDHPFWKKSFEITNPKDLATLMECGIQEIWIDTDKGLDIDSQDGGLSEAEAKQNIEHKLQQAAESPSKLLSRVSMEAEIAQARQIHSKAKEAVTSMFNETRMGKALQLEEISTLVDDISLSITRNPEAFLSLSRLKTKDNYTYLHSVAVCALMIALGKQMGLDQALLKDLGMAGLLHDIGKMMIPDEVLNKPGKLSDEEFNTVKNHPLRGWEILKDSPGVCDIAIDVCLHHHERMDGKGYPRGLTRDQMSVQARVMGIADIFEALTAKDRPYKKGKTLTESLTILGKFKLGGHIDPDLFDIFISEKVYLEYAYQFLAPEQIDAVDLSKIPGVELDA